MTNSKRLISRSVRALRYAYIAVKFLIEKSNHFPLTLAVLIGGGLNTLTAF